MATITEDYCSKEIYKLLVEKGFNGEIHTSFDKEGYTQPSITLQMAMKWLREEYNWHIEIGRGSKGYLIWIVTIPSGVARYITEEVCGKGIRYLDTYESACEATIKYCLEHLI